MDPDELEFMENVFDALCSALNEPQIKILFLSAEGPDLMVLMMKFVFVSLYHFLCLTYWAGRNSNLNRAPLRH
jgi:hypothetical protein